MANMMKGLTNMVGGGPTYMTALKDSGFAGCNEAELGDLFGYLEEGLRRVVADHQYSERGQVKISWAEIKKDPFFEHRSRQDLCEHWFRLQQKARKNDT